MGSIASSRPNTYACEQGGGGGRGQQNMMSISSTMYNILNKSSGKNIVWECLKCGMPNFSTSLFDTVEGVRGGRRCLGGGGKIQCFYGVEVLVLANF